MDDQKPIIITETGFWLGDKHITHMESEVEPIHKKKSIKIPKKVLRRWSKIIRMMLNNEK